MVAIMTSLFVSTSAFALNSSTPGSVSLTATFECIGVQATFTGDDNQNNTCVFKYRKAGDSTWIDAFTPFVDRRTNLGDGSVNSYINQARGSIVGLKANTSYEVLVTWSDTDGIVGSASSTTTVSTLTYTPPATGAQLWVDASVAAEGTGTSASPYKTITTALQNANPGDTINVRAGSYAPFVWSKSGTANNYIVLKSAAGNNAIITGGAINYNIQVNADYLVIDGFRMLNTQLSGVEVKSGHHDIYVQNTYMPDVGTATTWGSAALTTAGSCHHIYALTNTWITARDSTVLQGLDAWYRLGDPQSVLVCSDNTISGTFWDAFGGSGAGRGHRDLDMSRNTVSGFIDDGVELDGDAINMRIFSNTFNSAGHDCISGAPVYVGPSYVFRNVLRGSETTGVFKLGIVGGQDGPLYILHNTADSSVNTDGLTAAGGGAYKNVYYYNNINKNKDKCLAPGIGTAADNHFDYNVYGTYGSFRVTWNYGETENYYTLASYQSAKSQDLHSVDAQTASLWSDAQYHLLSNSPAVDKGMLIPNFNDAKSAWPFAGVAPDAGAFEVGTPITVQAPATPTGFRLVGTP